MARQSTTPVTFNKTTRKDTAVLMTSARAGVVVPVAYVPLLPGDSASGAVGIDIQLKEMPRPLLNGVSANIQAWFVPKSAHPRFAGRDELMHSWTGEKIKTLGTADRDPPPYFVNVSGANKDVAVKSDLFKKLGIHIPSNVAPNADLIDAFAIIYNFRLAAHSSRLKRRKYFTEDVAEATSLPPAFWPSSRFARVVPDYERALVMGALDLDVIAGRLPLSGAAPVVINQASANNPIIRKSGTGIGTSQGSLTAKMVNAGASPDSVAALSANPGAATAGPLKYDPNGTLVVDTSQLFALGSGSGTKMSVSLADIDKARTTQAFAKLRTAYAGNDATGFDNDDTIVAHLMQGLPVPEDQFKRPWLLDSQRVPVGFAERHATDGASLDQSVTLGRASARLSLNVPITDVGGMIIVTVEVLPERIDERMSDEFLNAVTVDKLPNALRDSQRTEPVDLVLNRRIDARHATPNGLYGYEPMNDAWNRDFTRLGGEFFMSTPGGGFKENRSNIWQTEIKNPNFTKTHYLAPSPFPHGVFADAKGDAFEAVVRHSVSIVGLTQIGDILAENNDDYDAIQNGGMPA